MRKGLRILNLLLLVPSWLLALLGVYTSLVSGLAPSLAVAIFALWTVLTLAVYRWTNQHATGKSWRLVLPALFLLLSYSCFAYAFRMLREIYFEQHGFPRRYYSTETK